MRQAARQAGRSRNAKGGGTGHAANSPVGAGRRSGVNRCAIEHNAPFCKVAAFTPLRSVRCNDRFAPFGFAERGVMSCAPPRLPRGRCAAALNSQHVCPRAAGTRASSRRCAQYHVNFHEPPPAQASWPAGSHCVARSPQAMPAFPVRPQGGSPVRVTARAPASLASRSPGGCAAGQRKGAVCKRCKPPCRLAPHLHSVSRPTPSRVRCAAARP